jgi:hypothetical protein
MLLQQDVIRRDILNVEDDIGNPAIGLIEKMALYGKDNYYDVIIEGILGESKYGDMLRRLVECFDASHVYYLDVPFEEALKRHQTKPDAHEFDAVKMRDWWRAEDYLMEVNEKMITAEESVNDIIHRILADTVN